MANIAFSTKRKIKLCYFLKFMEWCRRDNHTCQIKVKLAKYCVVEHTAKTKRILINHCRKERRHLHDQNTISHYYVHTMERTMSTRSLRHPKYGVQGIEIGWLALTNYRAHTQTQKALSNIVLTGSRQYT